MGGANVVKVYGVVVVGEVLLRSWRTPSVSACSSL